MSSDGEKKSTDRATLVGAGIGFVLATTTTILVVSGIFSVAWNRGAAKLFDRPDLSWAESLGVIVCLWIVAIPFRIVRVKMSE